MKSSTLYVVLFVLSFLLVQQSHADELKLRGGFSTSVFSQYTFALDQLTRTTPTKSGYGYGTYGVAVYSMDNVYGDVGLDFAVQFGQLNGADSQGEVGRGSCNVTGVAHFLGLINDCADTADTKNRTTFGDLSMLANFPIGNTKLLFGPSYMRFTNDLDVEYLSKGVQDGFNNFVSRNTEFTGFGFKIGAQHLIRVKHGIAFNFEGLFGFYRGKRSLRIAETELSIFQFSEFQETQINKIVNVMTWDLTASVSKDVTIWVPFKVEFGINYKTLKGVVDTGNYIQVYGTLPSEKGKINDNIHAASAFVGIAIPF